MPVHNKGVRSLRSTFMAGVFILLMLHSDTQSYIPVTHLISLMSLHISFLGLLSQSSTSWVTYNHINSLSRL